MNEPKFMVSIIPQRRKIVWFNHFYYVFDICKLYHQFTGYLSDIYHDNLDIYLVGMIAIGVLELAADSEDRQTWKIVSLV